MFRILVVDDDENIRKYFSKVLTAEHFDVVTARNGIEALDVLEKFQVDLVVLDVMMPGMDGYEFAESVRATNAQLPILMVTAKLLPEDMKRGFRAGTDDYMTKPVDAEEMVLRIKALLRRARISAERRITIGDVVLDYEAFTVTGHGQIFELPQKEFQLLYKLLSYPGQIFTRLQLLDEIWGMDSESGTETVTVHIARLRKRFEGWDEFEILSVRGLGYKAVKNV